MTTVDALAPARVVPPGRILSRELEARGWTQKDLAQVLRRPPQAISEIVNGTKQITPETALELAEALGTSPELWTNLESNYRLFLARQSQREKDIALLSKLYSLAPVSELVSRSWIRPSDSPSRLALEVCKFLDISSPDEEPQVAVRFRHAEGRGPERTAQTAWVKRVEHLAGYQKTPRFDRANLKKALPEILANAETASDVARIPTLLQGIGIRFVIVKHLPKSFIDGAVLYADGGPIISLTLRYDRVDAFWFALMHEIAHIALKHPVIHLETIYGSEGNQLETEKQEQEANLWASEMLVEQKLMVKFISENKPYFSSAQIRSFSKKVQRHPGIVLGQLQHRGEVSYKNLRSLLVPISGYLAKWIDGASLPKS